MAGCCKCSDLCPGNPDIGDQNSRWDIWVTSPKSGVDSVSYQQVAGKPMVISGTTNLGMEKAFFWMFQIIPLDRPKRTTTVNLPGTLNLL